MSYQRVERLLGVVLVCAGMLTSTRPLHAQDYYWDGSNNSNINSASNWAGNNKPSFNISSEVWNFDTAVINSPNVNQPNVKMGGYHFRSGSGGYSITGSQVYDVYGFNVGGQNYAIYNDTANTQTINNSGLIKFHGSNLGFHTGTGKIKITATSDYTQTTRTFVDGDGDIEFTGSVNVNSVRFQFSNSGVNDIRVAFNSAEELVIDGGSTTTFHQNTSVNNSGTLVTNFSVAHFDSTFNSNKLTIAHGAKVYIGGSASHNGGIDLKCGTLLIKKSNAIGNHNLNFQGGIFNMQGFSEGLNNLSLSKNSTIDFGAGAGSNSLNFQGAGSFASGTMLTVLNWQNGDQFQVLNIGSSKAQQVRFYGDFGSGLGFYQAQLNGNTLRPGSFLYENAPDALNCVPQPVPEPSTYLMGGALMIALGWIELRRRSAKTN